MSLYERFDACMYQLRYPGKRITSIHSIELPELDSLVATDDGWYRIEVKFQNQNHQLIIAKYRWKDEVFIFEAASYASISGIFDLFNIIPDRMIRPFTQEVFHKIRLSLVMM